MMAARPPEERTKQHAFECLLTLLADEGAAVKRLYPERPGRQGRVPMFELVLEAVVGNSITPSDFRRRTGLDPSLEITMQEFAMWAFRDLQAQGLSRRSNER